MDTLTMVLIALRGAAMVLDSTGKTREGNYVRTVADLAQSGKNVDDHMRAVAEAMKSGAPKDWQGAIARLEADSARLQAQAPPA